MMDRPAFKPGFHIEVVDPEGVFLLSERDHFVLKGELHCRLAPLIDGCHSADDIVDKLADFAPPAEVYYALSSLERKGYIVEADDAVPADRAAFWHALSLDAGRSERRLKKTTVSLAQFGAVAAGSFASTLAALNIPLGEDGALTVVLTDDYLQDGLGDFNAAALTSGRPWLLLKPLGTVLWIGPLFRPGKTGCWACLAHRLRANREVESYLQHKKATAAICSLSRAALPATVETALHLAATETAKAIVRGDQQAPDGTLTTLDVLTLETQKHRLVRRPQCPSCGDLACRSDREPMPVTLQTQRKRFIADGGHRTASPEQTIAKYEHHISPITGAVTFLSRVPANDERSLHVYVAGHNLATKPDSLDLLRLGLRSKNAGKGMTDAQARASGLCEVLERYSGNFQGDEIRKPATYRRLGASAIHPNDCMLFSEAQYLHRHEWNAHPCGFNRIPDPFDEEVEIEWTPVWSLTQGEFKYLPTGYCYYGYPMPPGGCYCWADSNGNAAGNTLEEAILQGFMELVERDSVCLWWYNRVRRPAVDLDSFHEPYIQQLRQRYRELSREVWVLDLMSDLRIPAFAAISRRTDQAAENIVLGFGAHFDPRIGLLRALTELNQSVAFSTALDRSEEFPYSDPILRRWWTTATLTDHTYLAPDDSAPLARSDYDLTWSDDLREDVLRCRETVARQGMEMLVLDQTRPDIGLPVVKVIVPGLRHFWARLGPGRLYDVPVKLGWLPVSPSEEQLNPIPMFL